MRAVRAHADVTAGHQQAQVPVLAVSHAKGGGKDPKERERDKEKERQAAAAAAAKQQLGIKCAAGLSVYLCFASCS